MKSKIYQINHNMRCHHNLKDLQINLNPLKLGNRRLILMLQRNMAEQTEWWSYSMTCIKKMRRTIVNAVFNPQAQQSNPITLAVKQKLWTQPDREFRSTSWCRNTLCESFLHSEYFHQQLNSYRRNSQSKLLIWKSMLLKDNSTFITFLLFLIKKRWVRSRPWLWKL